MGTYKQEILAAMAQVLVRDRVFELYAAGKTIEEIAIAMSPWGTEHPSPVTGIVRGIIEVALGRGEIAEH